MIKLFRITLSYMDKITLSPQQKEAVEYGEGPLLIIAGAGTGKTTVITERIKYLILEKNIKPEEILALTFTEKAASEMEERVDKIMPYGYTQMWISTFHSFCDNILREEAINIGLNPAYRLLTEAEIILFLKRNLFNLPLSYYRPLSSPTKFLEALLEHFSRLADEDIAPEEYLQYAKKLNARRYTLVANREEAKKTLELAKAYKIYSDLKAKEGVIDFSDLISNTLLLFRKRSNILKKYQEKFKFILVDEFQDTNYAQNELAIMLAGKKKNIAVVADDDQSIYRWRGAAISNVLQFKKNFKTAKIITLTQNFRSTQKILDHAYQLIQHNNPNRLEVAEKINKKLTSVRKIQGKPIEFIKTARLEEETEAIARRILKLVTDQDKKYQDIAILVRANNHAHSITTTLQRFKIPYQFLGPGQLFHQEEIKDLIAYLKVLYDLSDTVSLYRMLNMDVFNIEPRELNHLLSFSRKKNLTLFEALARVDETFLKEEAREKLATIHKMILRHLDRVKKDSAGQLLYYFLIDSGLYKRLVDYKTQKDEQKALNIAKFFDKIKSHETESDRADLYSIVDWVDLMMELGESPQAVELDWKEYNAVNILTVHSSKGLEFPVVFLVNLVVDRFPTRERREKIEIPDELIKEVLPTDDYHLQEERRLFYVGITRTRDLLIMTASNYYGEGKRVRKISPFVYEAIPEIKESERIEEKETQQLSLIETTEGYKIKEERQEKPFPLKITSISYSQIQTFNICPLHYKARYILNIPTPPSAVQTFGITIHLVLKELYEALKQGKELGLNDLLTLLKQKWISDGYFSKTHEKEYFSRAQHILKSYYKKHYDPKNIPLDLELPFSFYLDQDLKVVGKIDRIDKTKGSGIEIIDYKTGQLKQLSNSYRDPYQFQLGMYALAARRVKHPSLGRKPEDVTLTLFYIESGEKITGQITSRELQTLIQKIKEKVREIEKSDFACSRNVLCANCEYKMLCQTT